MTVDVPKLPEEILHDNDLFIDHERQITLIGAGTLISMVNILQTAENIVVSQSLNRPIRKTIQKPPSPECVNANHRQQT